MGTRRRLASVLLLASIALAPAAADASASQARSRIVFTGTSGLTSADAAGGDQQVLIRNQSSQFADLPYNPSWSPDGSWVAFMRGFEIWVTRADGSDTRRVALFKANVPSWSADGQVVYYTGFFGGGTSIMAANLDGSPGPDFGGPTGGNEAGAQWSPSGARVAFASDAGDGHYRVYVMDADGSGLRAITDGAADEFPHDWSPDGRRLLVNANVDMRRLDVVVVDADGGNHRVVRTNAVPQAWSPDGRKILFYDASGGQLQTMNVDGTGAVGLEGMGGTGDWGPGSVDADTPPSPTPTPTPTPTPVAPAPNPGPFPFPFPFPFPTRTETVTEPSETAGATAAPDSTSTTSEATATTSAADSSPGGRADGGTESAAGLSLSGQPTRPDARPTIEALAASGRTPTVALALALLAIAGAMALRFRHRLTRT